VGSATGRFDYPDGIRAIAICAVLSLHWLAWYSPFFHGGSIGVDVFFVLSGFIITTMLWRSPMPASVSAAWRAFVRRRVTRLYPALLGFVLLTVVMYALVPLAPVDPADVARRGLVALSQGSAIWAAALGEELWLTELNPFGQTWSLAVEWYFYLLWPLPLLTARMRGWHARWLAVVSAASAVLLYLLSLPLDNTWFYFGPTARFAEILVGGALALWFQADGGPARPSRYATPGAWFSLAAVAAYSLLGPYASSPVYRYIGVPMTVLATVTLIYVGYSNRSGPVQRLLGHPWVSGVGRYSYSIYLWHMVPVLLLEEASHVVPKPVLGLVAVVATVLLTVAGYHLLERPFLRPRGSLLGPQPPRVEHSPVRQRGDEVVG